MLRLLRPRSSGSPPLPALIVSRAPVARRLISTSPRSSPFGPTITCQGRPIRSMRGELGAGALVEVIVEHRNSGIREALVQGVAGRIDGRVAGLEVDQADLERRDAVRPDDAGLVVARLDDRRDQARHADAVGAAVDRRARRRPARTPSPSSAPSIWCRNRRSGRPRCRACAAAVPPALRVRSAPRRARPPSPRRTRSRARSAASGRRRSRRPRREPAGRGCCGRRTRPIRRSPPDQELVAQVAADRPGLGAHRESPSAPCA